MEELLKEQGREAVNMMFYEMTDEDIDDLAREDGYADGETESGILERLVKCFELTESKAAECLRKFKNEK